MAMPMKPIISHPRPKNTIKRKINRLVRPEKASRPEASNAEVEMAPKNVTGIAITIR